MDMKLRQHGPLYCDKVTNVYVIVIKCYYFLSCLDMVVAYLLIEVRYFLFILYVVLGTWHGNW